MNSQDTIKCVADNYKLKEAQELFMTRVISYMFQRQIQNINSLWATTMISSEKNFCERLDDFATRLQLCSQEINSDKNL